MENFFGPGYLFFFIIVLYSTLVAGDIEALQQSRVIEESDIEHDIALEEERGLEDGKYLHLIFARYDKFIF